MLPITTSNPGYPGASGSPFGPVNSVTSTASQSTVLPLGLWVVSCGTEDTVEFYQSSSITTKMVAVSSAAVVPSDGQNVKIVNGGTVGTATTYTQVLGL